MPVLINNQTQLAEDLPQQAADQAIQTGSHSLPLNDADGNPVSAGLSEAPGLLSQGHSQPTPAQLQSLLDYAKYSSTGQQAKTFLEGAGEGATFGLSSQVEKMAGVDPKDILGRRDTNPGTHMVGQLAGIGATSMLGVGEGAALAEAGELAALKSGAGVLAPFTDLASREVVNQVVSPGMSLVSRAALTGVKQMTEMALLQGGDEASKMLLHDPNQSMETALVDIGLASAMGGALGFAGHAATEPLWNAVSGSQLSKLLTGIKNKALGVESADIMADMAEKSGLQISPELRASMSGEASTKKAAQDLIDSGTTYGDQFRAQRDATIESSKGEAMKALGREPEDLERIHQVSDFQSGENVRKALTDELTQKFGPVTEKYGQIEEKFAKEALPEGTRQTLGEDLGQLALKEGYTKSPSAPELGVINTIIKELPLQETVNDLRRYGSIAYDKAAATGNWHFASQVRSIVRDATETALKDTVGSKAPELLQTLQEAAQGYKANAQLVDALNDRLHVGKYGGPQGFLRSLGEMRPEDLLRRITQSNDAGLLDVLQKELPQTANAVRNEHINSIVYKASQAASPTKAILKQVENMSPELKQFALPEGAGDKLTAIDQVLQALPKKEGFSQTPRVLDKMWKELPGGAGAMISLASGHNPLMGFIFGKLGRFVGREAPDMGKMAFLKFLGSDAPVSAQGFKALYETSASMVKGLRGVDKATKNLFRAGTEVVPTSFLPSERDKAVIDKAVRAAQTDPAKFQGLGGNIGHYLPDHAAALGAVTGRATTYLSGLLPNTAKPGPLDPNRIPTTSETAKYNRAVSLVAQPLQLLQHIKDGTVLPEDIKTVSTVYPSLHQYMQSAVMHHMSDYVSQDNKVSLDLHPGLTMLLGSPVTASLAPQSIAMNQATFAPPPGPQRAPGASRTKNLSKMASTESTPQQSREQKKLS